MSAAGTASCGCSQQWMAGNIDRRCSNPIFPSACCSQVYSGRRAHWLAEIYWILRSGIILTNRMKYRALYLKIYVLASKQPSLYITTSADILPLKNILPKTLLRSLSRVFILMRSDMSESNMLRAIPIATESSGRALRLEKEARGGPAQQGRAEGTVQPHEQHRAGGARVTPASKLSYFQSLSVSPKHDLGERTSAQTTCHRKIW